MKQPLDQIEWIHRDNLNSNDYNPNYVAPPEMELLELSIIEEGWTQPIVVNPDMTIVDGYHRFLVSGRPEVYKLTSGEIPIVKVKPKDHGHQKMATIRHNRARGTHAVVEMSTIVTDLVNSGYSGEEIMSELRMEKE
jgi:ParB-like chromosome segregation protein Spo0J